MKDKPAPIKIYVGNIPTSARNSELKELFEKFGKVVECDILKDFGFVHMKDKNDAKAAIAGLHDTLWKGCRVRVELSTTRTNKGEPSERSIRESRSGGPSPRHRSDRHNPLGHRIGGADRIGRGPVPRDAPYGMSDRLGMRPLDRNGSGGGPIREGRGGNRYPMDRGIPPSRSYPINDYGEYNRGGPMMLPPPPFRGGAGAYGFSGGPPYGDRRGGNDNGIYDSTDLSHELRSESGSYRNDDPHRRSSGSYPPIRSSNVGGSSMAPPPPHHMMSSSRDEFYRGGPPPPPPHHHSSISGASRYDSYGPPRGSRYNNF